MNVLDMSLAASLLILVIAVVRFAGMHRLPKVTFLILWAVALVRLLVPYSVSSKFSIFSAMDRATVLWRQPVQQMPATAADIAESIFSGGGPAPGLDPGVTVPGWSELSGLVTGLWGFGVAVCALFFLGTHWRWRQTYKTALPVAQKVIPDWLVSRRGVRRIAVRQSDQIAAPLTYGIWKPVILLPKSTDWADTAKLQYIFTHEYVHIRRFDTLFKWLMAAAVCLHWFNPLVWLMYILVNRDIELSCDEAVVRKLGVNTKSVYAKTLIDMEEERARRSPLCSHFSRNPVEERIRSIMKLKQLTPYRGLLALLLIAGISLVFATKGATLSKESSLDQALPVTDNETQFAYTATGTDESAGIERMDSVPAIEWWTPEEYEAWLDQEKQNLKSLIGSGARSWTPSTGWFTWTEDKVEETVRMYEETLEAIRQGSKVSKSVGGDKSIVVSEAG